MEYDYEYSTYNRYHTLLVNRQALRRRLSKTGTTPAHTTVYNQLLLSLEFHKLCPLLCLNCFKIC